MPPINPYRVLCVDDDEEACEMLSLLLKSQGIEVTGAQSAVEARLKIKAESFDLFTLDSWLPTVDGFELCREIRQSDSRTPILFYSGAAYEVDKEKGLAAGANAYVTKPDIEGLIETAEKLIATFRLDQLAVSHIHDRLPAIETRFSTQLRVLTTVA